MPRCRLSNAEQLALLGRGLSPSYSPALRRRLHVVGVAGVSARPCRRYGEALEFPPPKLALLALPLLRLRISHLHRAPCV